MGKTITVLTTLTGITPPDLETEKKSVAASSWSFNEVKGDLFSCGDSVSMAHCISRDLRLGKGIAVLFKNKFGRIDEMREQNPKVGGMAVLQDKKRFVYNLVSKEQYWNKPTYADLRVCCEGMREHAVKHSVTHIAMPKIGCGLDGLLWPKVKDLLRDVFGKTVIAITVYFI